MQRFVWRLSAGFLWVTHRLGWNELSPEHLTFSTQKQHRSEIKLFLWGRERSRAPVRSGSVQHTHSSSSSSSVSGSSFTLRSDNNHFHSDSQAFHSILTRYRYRYITVLKVIINNYSPNLIDVYIMCIYTVCVYMNNWRRKVFFFFGTVEFIHRLA